MRKEDLEKYVLKQVRKAIFNDSLIERLLEEYNQYASEATISYSAIDMLKEKIKDIDTKIKNIVTVIEDGHSSQILLDKLVSLEESKQTAVNSLAKEQKGGNYMPISKGELIKAYKRARVILEQEDIDEIRRVVRSFINKIIIYKNHVEIFINLIPAPLNYELDLDININELIAGNAATSELDGIYTENQGIYTENNIEKDGFDPSFSNNEFIGNSMSGSSSWV